MCWACARRSSPFSNRSRSLPDTMPPHSSFCTKCTAPHTPDPHAHNHDTRTHRIQHTARSKRKVEVLTCCLILWLRAGDYHRYMAEVTTGAERARAEENAISAYVAGSALA